MDCDKKHLDKGSSESDVEDKSSEIESPTRPTRKGRAEKRKAHNREWQRRKRAKTRRKSAARMVDLELEKFQSSDDELLGNRAEENGGEFQPTKKKIKVESNDKENQQSTANGFSDGIRVPMIEFSPEDIKGLSAKKIDGYLKKILEGQNKIIASLEVIERKLDTLGDYIRSTLAAGHEL